MHQAKPIAGSVPADPRFAELDALAGEVLPARTALSAVTGSPAAPTADPGRYAVPDGHGGTVYYACQTTHSEGSGGVVGALGLGQPPSTTTTCMPAAVENH